ncbi:hypothetical protein BLA60_20180 [Actinophytocola xinjiangensis]|uniref:Uncharacterized protein n=1 Tax=Actinophytocola xinjiangensis TaxID=485602 RepID=A0A7Z0WKH9_9PSEU|nr:hypothetical protein [Actinophytocola xinjiangensis]OLF09476.1 hypothetical protein BLA60_20180 [Actinophytocola xinjiangensis]
MDEHKLSELLRDAVADVPPPTFDQGDVVRESARQRVRRRNGLLTGSALGVALLAGATALSVALWTGTDSSGQPNAASGDSAPGNGTTAPYELEEEKAADAPSAGGDTNSSPESRKQGRTSGEEAGPAGPGSTPSGCEQADRELAAALAGELPAAALPAYYTCPSDVTNITYDLYGGRLTVMLLDAGSLMASDDEPGWTMRQAVAETADGRHVMIFSAARDPGTPPFADELEDLAERVAGHY